MSTGAAVVVDDVSFAYGKRQALCNVGFEVPIGQVFGCLGPNGSGKSTLFKLLSTLVPLQSGRVTMLGLDLAGATAEIRRRIGVVFQSPAVDKKLTVRENLHYAGLLLGLGGSELRQRSDRMLAVVGLVDRATDLVGALSGGLRRRVELAKCLLAQPDLVLLDEASTGLDPAARRDMWSVLREQRLTVLFTTHLMDEATQADQLVLMDQGQIVAAGRPAELMREVGGQVLELEVDDAAAVLLELERVIAVAPKIVDGRLRYEGEAVPDLVPRVVRVLGPRLRRLQLAHPSLEDVFLSRTGKRFVVTEPEPPVKGRSPRR